MVEGKVDNDRKDDGADDTSRPDAEVDRDRCEQAGGERDDADDNRGLCRRLSFDFEGKFHASSDGDGKEKQKNLRKRAEKAPVLKEGIQGQCRRRKLRRRHLHGSWGGLKNLLVRK